jgi:hypothetical protein
MVSGIFIGLAIAIAITGAVAFWFAWKATFRG